MPQYKAMFFVPAQVLVTLVVTGEDQHQGLVAAHDALRHAKASDAQVVSMDLETFELNDFHRQSDEAPLVRIESCDPKGPLDIGRDFTVTLYQGLTASSAVNAQSQNLAYAKAKELADTVLLLNGPSGYAEVRDSHGALKYFNKAPRGGWEVEATAKSGTHRDTLTSWLPDDASAKKEALRLVLTKNFSSVRVFDTTNRLSPSVLVRELR